MLPLVTPPQSSPVLTGGLFQRVWYLFLNNVQQWASAGLQMAQEGLRVDREAVSPADVPDGALWVETDTGLTYQARHTSVPAWVWISGTYSLAQSDLTGFAAELGSDDTGLLVLVNDYGHVLEWTGSDWQWGPGEQGSGMLVPFAIAPTGVGWHACDGSAGVTYLKSDGTTDTVTLPDTAGSSAYLKAGNTYAPSIATAQVPTISAPIFTGTPSNTGTASAGSQGSGATGNTLTQASHTHSFTPAGTVSVPVATLPGDPVANFGVLLYFRQ